MTAYCKFTVINGKQTCTVCNASFAAGQKLMAVCGVDRPREPPPPGAGTQLKKLLARLGIRASPTCRCASKAKMMDYKGVDWCEENIETITEWLKDEATKRGLPFINTAGRMLVRRAISNARREEERVKGTA